MATPVTILNIGRQLENIPGGPLAQNDTLVVDLDDEAVQAELRNDADYVVLPDSAAGTLPPAGGGIEAYDSATAAVFVGDGVAGGDVLTDLGLSVVNAGDGVTAKLITLQLNKVGYQPAAGASMQADVYLRRDGVLVESVGWASGIVDYQKQNSVAVGFEIPAEAGNHTYTFDIATNGPANIVYVSNSGEHRHARLDAIPA